MKNATISTSRERVAAVFAGETPDRTPLWVGMSPNFEAKACRELDVDVESLRCRFGDDFRRISANWTGPATGKQTPFGVSRHGIGYGMAINHPLAHVKNQEEIERYPWPSPDWTDVSTLRMQAAYYQRQYAVLGGDWSPFWHDAIDLVGMENLYLLMFDAPELAHLIFDRIIDYYLEVNRKILNEAGDCIDILFIGNDLGSQNGPLLSPDLFREFVLPGLKKLIDLGHRYQLKVQLHCCGGVAELLEDLIIAGLDAIHAVQSSCRGMELTQLKQKFASQIVFNGGIDSHHILLDGTPEVVRKATERVLDIMTPGGYYIAGASHDTILEETPVENVLAMCDVIKQYQRNQ